MFKPVIFREYDIRGVFNHDYDLEFAFDLGRAYAAYHFKTMGIKNATVTVGYDARESSPLIFEQIKKGLNASGFNVLCLGLITSPISYYSTFAIPEVSGSIMITGSHNPPEYNGFKISVGKTTIFGEAILELQKIIEKKSYLNQGTGTSKDYDIFPQYVARYKEEFKSLAGVKVVFDCGNGAAGCILKRLCEAIEMKPTILFEQPDGRFPNHHPDPTVEKNLKDLKAAVQKEGAIVGIGFDGDADRIGIVDENGKMILGDELMVLISRSVLKAKPGEKIIGDVKCSDRLFADIKLHGGEPIMWKTGHSLVKEKIKVEKAPFGGEMSGHVFFADRNYGYDDAIYAGLRLVEILAHSKKKITELLSDLPTAFNTPELRIDTTEEKKVLIVEKLKEKFAIPSDNYKTNLLDGIRVSFKDGWALARASNTQPVLVLRYESSTQAGLDRIRKDFESVVNKYL